MNNINLEEALNNKDSTHIEWVDPCVKHRATIQECINIMRKIYLLQHIRNYLVFMN